MRDMVLVLNFDDAASRAVTRKLRSERIFCKILPGSTALEEILQQEPLGLLLCGGVAGKCGGDLDRRILDSGLPVLAMGDAAAMLLNALGGQAGEIALRGAVINLNYQNHGITQQVENGERLLQCVRDFALPQEVIPICRAEEIVVGFAHETRPLYGFQFQVEQNDLEGSQILRNFVMSVCGCTPWWDEDAFVARAVEEIGRVVGTQGRAVCAMTGGADSGVAALLAYQALGSRLQCIFVDTGLLRDNESQDFLSFYRDRIGMSITRVDAEDRFLQALQGVGDAGEKRRIISDLMHDILNETVATLGAFDAVIRGTSYNDVMAGRPHRRLLPEPVPEIMPVQELFKDEIRRIGEFLGMPADVMSRQPFPGSGLALRILGEVTKERLRTLRHADAIFRCEVQQSSAVKRLWQYFAVLSPMPGERDEAVICLRAVHASERTLAYAARLPYDVMETVTDRVLRECPGVRRVVYDLTPSSHYAGIEWQ